MYKILYDYKTIESLKKFVDSYKNTYIRMIEDSGLEVEDFLIESYIKNGQNLYFSLIEGMNRSVSQDIILGRVKQENIDEFIIIRYNNFRIFVYYRENILDKVRIITQLEFFKK